MLIGVAAYKLSDSLPEDMKEMLPESEEIVKRMKSGIRWNKLICIKLT